MKKAFDRAFTVLIAALTAVSAAALAFVIFFIVKEALPLFETVSLKDFLLGQRWMPIAYTGSVSFGIANFIAGTLYVSFAAMVLALFFSLGCAVYLSCVATDRQRSLLYPVIDLLAGIPSVVYGFIGIVVLLKLMMKLGVRTGSCVLAAAIVLAIMLLPYLISGCSESMLKMKNRYMPASDAMGISQWHAMAEIVIPAAWKNILLTMVLAVGRAMGETMAVMMVMGNANLFPRLLGKGETIAAVIALEMGTAEYGSDHYHALYAASMVLMLLLFVINIAISLLRKRLLEKEV
ncbi:MAG: phosphate ABC transporter permease subunit PstC [Firmicutes bacterium]|nr:phosphate ABC transporter permease subunit PstC [Bacillota bacterium]